MTNTYRSRRAAAQTRPAPVEAVDAAISAATAATIDLCRAMTTMTADERHAAIAELVRLAEQKTGLLMQRERIISEHFYGRRMAHA